MDVRQDDAHLASRIHCARARRSRAVRDAGTHIRAYGWEGGFYRKPITYFAEDGLVYWTMGAPIPETTIINRCKAEDTFEARSKAGTLP